MHLVIQLMSFTSESMAKETVTRLQEIDRAIQDESEEAHESESSQSINKEKDEIKNLILKFEDGKQDGTTESVVQRLGTRTRQFQKLASGFSKGQYEDRRSLMHYIRQDLLEDPSGAEDPPISNAPQK